ncbi:MAG: DUF1566 domain-containing protein [Prolixibacteraceae bacterium]|mgnify:FL=1|nr:DUF1566 domain-containing protein [Prolixibacteraceae bacterium]
MKCTAMRITFISLSLLILFMSNPSYSVAENGRFIAYDNGTVLDMKTNLMWASKDSGDDMNWPDAKTYCKYYSGGGYTDWRMPTPDEIAGLYDASKSQEIECGSIDTSRNHIATDLIHITCINLWASKTRGSKAAFFTFMVGAGDWWPKSVTNRVLPVRSAYKEGPNAEFLQRLQLADKHLTKFYIKCGDNYFVLPKNQYVKSYNQFHKEATLSTSYFSYTPSDVEKANGVEFKGRVKKELNGKMCREYNNSGWSEWTDECSKCQTGVSIRKKNGSWTSFQDYGDLAEFSCSDLPALSPAPPQEAPAKYYKIQ